MKRNWSFTMGVVAALGGFAVSANAAPAQHPTEHERQGAARLAAEPEASQGDAQASAPVRVSLEGITVPRLVKFSGMLKDERGEPRKAVVGLTFAIYREQEGGAPLWMETQDAELDEQGRYTVLLGATEPGGLPLELFTAGEARWLGVQVQLPGEVEQTRVLLVSVPYALKAADAERLGGKPASAFVLAEEARVLDESAAGTSATDSTSAAAATDPDAVQQHVSAAAVSGSGTPNFIARFTSANAVGNSIIFQNLANNIGIGTTNPAARLEVNGDIRLFNSTLAASGRWGQDGSRGILGL